MAFVRLLTILCLLVWLSFQNVFAQVTYEGNITDAEMGTAIPFATVTLLKSRLATRTDEYGKFSFTVGKLIATDTLLFTCVGYKAYQLPVSAYRNGLKIALHADVTNLKEVIVGHKIRTVKLDAFSDNDINPPGEFVKWDDPLFKLYTLSSPLRKMTFFAKEFDIPVSGATITNIQFARGGPQENLFYYTNPSRFTNFKIHVLTVAADNITPGEIIFTREVMLRDNGNRISFDFKPDEIILPATKFFIAIEWMRVPFNEYIEDKVDYVSVNEDKDIMGLTGGYYILYQPILMGYKKKKTKTPSWIKIKNAWQHFNHPDFEVALSVNVNY